MPNYYFFEPLVDEKGEQVVRCPKEYEWYVDPANYPTEMWPDIEQVNVDEWPILVLKKFDHDPLERIKKVAEKYKQLQFPYPNSQAEVNKELMILHALGVEAIQAISETVKELEVK